MPDPTPLPAHLTTLKTDVNRSLLVTGDFPRLNAFLLDRLHESGWYETVYDMCIRAMRQDPYNINNNNAKDQDQDSQENSKNIKAEESAKSYKEIYERVEGEALRCVDLGVKEEVCRRIKEVLVGGGYVVEG